MLIQLDLIYDYDTLIYRIKNVQMQENQEDPIRIFTQQQKQSLFETLTSNTKFTSKPFTQQDFKVDLVLRLRIPQDEIVSREAQFQFDALFKNTPTHYSQVYHQVLEYVHYLAVTDPKIRKDNLPENAIKTRSMTSLHELNEAKPSNKIYLDHKQNKDNAIIDCQHEFLPDLDIFTVMYNMIMIILQQICGFSVRTFLLDNEQDKQHRGGKVVYFLLSQSNMNLLKMADKFELKKEVQMIEIDYTLNDPIDKKDRPIKYHSYFREKQGYRSFMKNDKYLSRKLGIKEIGINKVIYGEANFDDLQGKKYEEYSQLLSKQLLQLHDKYDATITPQEKTYIFNFNRRKINQGCLQLLAQKKMRKAAYQKIKELNKQFQYKVQSYNDAYFQFRMPTKSKPFFQKLDQLLCYKYYQVTYSGEISLFTKLERIKMAYLILQQYFKLQNFCQAGISMYALHDNFQRFGDRTHEDYIDNKSKEDSKDQQSQKKITSIDSSWHPFLPFLSNPKKLRDYFGQNVALEIMIKVYLLNFLLLVTPFSLVSQIIIKYYFKSQLASYRFYFYELTLTVITLSIFVEIWAKKQNQYFENFTHAYKHTFFLEGYRGPYYRNIATDQTNQHQISYNFKQRVVTFICHLIIISILVLQGVFFWGIRLSIVATYQRIPEIKWSYMSLPHIIFYGVYFVSNFFLYQIVFLPFIDLLVKWQNHSIKSANDKIVRFYRYGITFGVQFMGPIFLYIVEPFQGVSCYAAECTDQFTSYVYARYWLIFIYIFLKFHHFIWATIKSGLAQTIINDQNVRIKQYLSFEERLNYLLQYIRHEYKKQEIVVDLRDQSLALYYFVIFKINFPMSTIFTFGFLILDYIFGRIRNFRTKRRPIPIVQELYRQQDTFEIILHICIIFNSWALTFTYEYLEYDFKYLVNVFITNVSAQTILTFKIFIAGTLILFFEILSYFVRKIIYTLTYDPLQKRKKFMYEKYLYKIRQKPTKIDLPLMLPIKSIFRTFTYDGILENKRQKYKLYEAYKQRNNKYKILSMFQADTSKQRFQQIDQAGTNTNIYRS